MIQKIIKNQGSILIIVLWIIVLGIILVTAISSNIRLSATTVMHHKEALQDWSQTLEAVNKAYMELVIDKMSKIEVKKTALYNQDSEENRFDGRPLQLSYGTPEGIVVRIYDLSGKLNISGLSQDKLKKLLQHELGDETDSSINERIDAWLDWLDKDNLKRLNGAEADYYKKEKLAYRPRNDEFASVDEIRLIKGFTDLFTEVDLNEVLTLWGDASGQVNPNVATKETLMILPGMTEELANKLIKARQETPFKSIAEVNVHLTPITIAKLSGWFTFRKSSYYAIVIYPEDREDLAQPSQILYVYKEDVKIGNKTAKPFILRVNPYAKITIAHKKEKIE
jgi:general secretion pathway protein K